MLQGRVAASLSRANFAYCPISNRNVKASLSAQPFQNNTNYERVNNSAITMFNPTINGIFLLSIAVLANCEILEKSWWKHSVFYEIQPRSFLDSDADGVGDLKGITSKLNYFVDSGVQAIWLSSINPSPKYYGDDVTDYKDIDKSLGSMRTLKALVKKLKRLGLRVILDLVPNHTSDQHYWFERSVRREGKYTDYYVWAVGRYNNTCPPNNWVSMSGGSAWTYCNTRNMWYYHQFEADQPDLNYRNPWVKKEMEEVLRYWVDEGLDGFCIKDAPYIFESHGLRNESLKSATRLNIECVLGNNYTCLNHTNTKEQPETYELIGEWRRLLDGYASCVNTSEKVLMTEVPGNLMDIAKLYRAGSQVPLNLKFIAEANSSPSAGYFKRVIDDWMKALPEDGTPNWLMGGEKYSRLASRYPNRTDQMTMLSMMLPGITVTYYGDEIGMQDNMEISFKETRDLIARRAGPQMYEYISRDPHRTPYQWNNTTNAGFSTSNSTWLPVNKQYLTLNLARQEIMYESRYKVYRKLTSLRRTSAALKSGGLQTTVLHNDILMLVRNVSSERMTLLINFSNATEYRIQLNGTGTNTVLLTSVGAGIKSRGIINQTSVILPPNVSVLVATNVTTGVTKKSKSGATSTMTHPLNYALHLVLITFWLIKY